MFNRFTSDKLARMNQWRKGLSRFRHSSFIATQQTPPMKVPTERKIPTPSSAHLHKLALTRQGA
jgi:hypothetical protein